MTALTEAQKEVRLQRRRMLAEVATLKKAVEDPNVHAGNDIVASMERLETVRKEYAEAQMVAHTAWVNQTFGEEVK